MARTATLLSLRNQVRARAFLEASTSVVTDSEITEFINQSWAELHDELVASVQDYAIGSTAFVTVAGQTSYALPADFYKFRKLMTRVGGVDIDLRAFNLEELHLYTYQGGWFTDSPIAYRRLGSNVMLEPPPSTSGTSITMYYTTVAPRMTADGDTIDGQNGWEEFIVLDAACKCLDKLDRDCSRLERQREELRKRIIRMSVSANHAEPQRIIRRRTARLPVRGAR